MSDELVLSSIQPTYGKKHITGPHFEAIKRVLGVECLLVVIDDKMHECSDGCPGHFVHVRAQGFKPEQLRGVANMLMRDAEIIEKSHRSQP